MIVNLTPHPIVLIRPGRITCSYADATYDEQLECTKIVFPAASPDQLPRAIEQPLGHPGRLSLSVAGDTQDGYANTVTMMESGLVDFIGYVGVENLPPLTSEEYTAVGVQTFRIVSIVTAIGALAAGRPIVDLLIPMGQIRDAVGRVVGAMALAPAAALLTPMVDKLSTGSQLIYAQQRIQELEAASKVLKSEDGMKVVAKEAWRYARLMRDPELERFEAWWKEWIR